MIKMFKLTPEQIELLTQGLNTRICFIETGTSYLRATDAVETKQQELIKGLASDQRRLIVSMEDLITLLEGEGAR